MKSYMEMTPSTTVHQWYTDVPEFENHCSVLLDYKNGISALYILIY